MKELETGELSFTQGNEISSPEKVKAYILIKRGDSWYIQWEGSVNRISKEVLKLKGGVEYKLITEKSSLLQKAKRLGSTQKLSEPENQAKKNTQEENLSPVKEAQVSSGYTPNLVRNSEKPIKPLFFFN
jgi:hypothetical protein